MECGHRNGSSKRGVSLIFTEINGEERRGFWRVYRQEVIEVVVFVVMQALVFVVGFFVGVMW